MKSRDKIKGYKSNSSHLASSFIPLELVQSFRVQKAAQTGFENSQVGHVAYLLAYICGIKPTE